MSELRDIATIVHPARDLAAGIATWSAALGRPPTWQSPDYAVFTTGTVEIGLSRLPWFDHPLVFWKVESVDHARHRLIAEGATALGEIADGSMAELGSAPIVNGDPTTGIVIVPGRKLAVLRAVDGTLFGLAQEVPTTTW
jgi:hypothetical protein